MSNFIPLTSSSGALSVPDASTLSSYKKIQNDLQAVGKALQSGDVAGATTAFATLQKDAPNLAAQSQDRQSTNPRAQAMGLLGRALQAGDVTLAQKSLSALQQTMTGANQGDASSSSPDSTPTLASYLDDLENPSSNSSTQNPSLLNYTGNGATSSSNNGTPTPGSFLNSLA